MFQIECVSMERTLEGHVYKLGDDLYIGEAKLDDQLLDLDQWTAAIGVHMHGGEDESPSGGPNRWPGVVLAGTGVVHHRDGRWFVGSHDIEQKLEHYMEARIWMRIWIGSKTN